MNKEVSGVFSSQGGTCSLATECEIAEKEFFQQLEVLKRESNWNRIIELGKRVIQLRGPEAKEADLWIYLELASMSFYKGDYEAVKGFSVRAEELAQSSGNYEALISSLYHHSAYTRALADKEEDNELKQIFFAQAVELAQRAFSIVDRFPDTMLKAKVYFNLGAAHADNPEGDAQKALDCYQKAKTICEDQQQWDDYMRTAIRELNLCLARFDTVGISITTLRKSFDQSFLKAEASMSSRTRVMMYLAEARLLQKEGKDITALLKAQMGLSLACELNMNTDIKRLNKFIEGLST
ncbi:MAG: tetratricopeptide repeat protein [Chlamydiales bacterium]|nr:tetratricopeptide repeat protein [Chlamydiales bacterium]